MEIDCIIVKFFIVYRFFFYLQIVCVSLEKYLIIFFSRKKYISVDWLLHQDTEIFEIVVLGDNFICKNKSK